MRGAEPDLPLPQSCLYCTIFRSSCTKSFASRPGCTFRYPLTGWIVPSTTRKVVNGP